MRLVGEGASGRVYDARVRATGERLALKVLFPLGAQARSALEAAMSRLAGIEHPHLVKLHALHRHGDELAVTMAIVDGPTLLDYLGPRTPHREPARTTMHMAFGQVLPEGGRSEFRAVLPEGVQRLERVLPGIAAGLAELHARGLVHGDMAPGNVLVDRTGRARLVDYGFPPVASTDDDGAEVMGRAAYMAPQPGEVGQPSADLYALGVVLFEALTGTLPFTGSAQEMTMRKQTVPAPPVSLLVTGVPPWLDSLCTRLLARSPGRRPSAAAVEVEARGHVV